jgi:hypothetical protein
LLEKSKSPAVVDRWSHVDLCGGFLDTSDKDEMVASRVACVRSTSQGRARISVVRQPEVVGDETTAAELVGTARREANREFRMR